MKPRIIDELEILIEQATKERSHYYVKSVCEKAILAIGMLMGENKRLTEALNEIRRDTRNAETTMEANAYYLAEEALRGSKWE